MQDKTKWAKVNQVTKSIYVNAKTICKHGMIYFSCSLN